VRFEPERGFIGHYRSRDIKIDAPPYQPAPTASNFDAFVGEKPSAITGDVNRVYVRVRNRGPNTATSVTVRLFWTQFGTGLPPLPPDFWTAFPGNSTDPTNKWNPLACSTGSFTCTVTNLAYSGSSVAGTAADAGQVVQFDFPAPPVDPSLPNHFCLLGMIDSPDDRIMPLSRPTIPADFVVDALTPTDNNVTHRNYHNLSTGGQNRFEEPFFVRNPLREQVQGMLRLLAPEGWRIELDTLGFSEPFRLQAGQEVLVTMRALLPEPNLSGEVTIIQERVDVRPAKPMGGVTFNFEAPKAVRPPAGAGGVLSSYLIGAYDLREERTTIFNIVNPTPWELGIWIALFDDNERALTCFRETLTANDLLQIDVRRHVEPSTFGVAKIVALSPDYTGTSTGIVGYQMQIRRGGVSETVMHSVSNEVLEADLGRISRICR
jgi:hypothetical protein